MYVHILESGNKFVCGLLRNGERSFVSLDIALLGDLKPAGSTQFCAICKAPFRNRQSNEVTHV
jgi:hypothetical protein